MQLAELVRLGIEQLRGAGIPDCHTDVYLLLGHCLDKSRTELHISARDEIGELDVESFMALIERRKKREPVAYILGEQEFWSLPFLVTPDVLIPRPETEFLIEIVLASVADKTLPGTLVDLCCGSGVISVVLALELGRQVVGIDISARALEVSRKNVAQHGLTGQVHLVQSDLLSSLSGSLQASLIVSNPPYVSSLAIDHELEPEVACYEPRLALDGGEKGLELIRRIRRQLPALLMPGGQFFMEIGYDQGVEAAEMFLDTQGGVADFQSARVVKDLAGRDRILHAVKH